MSKTTTLSSSSTKLLQLQPPHKPLTSYSIFFRLERCYLYQKVLENANEFALDLPPPSHRFDPANPGFGADTPPFPKRYKDVILPKDFHLHTASERWQGKRRKHRKTEGALSLAELSRVISKNWKEADQEVIAYCEAISAIRKEHYITELVEYENQKAELLKRLDAGDNEGSEGGQNGASRDSSVAENEGLPSEASSTKKHSTNAAQTTSSMSPRRAAAEGSGHGQEPQGHVAAAGNRQPDDCSTEFVNRNSPSLQRPMCSSMTDEPSVPNTAGASNNSANFPRQLSPSAMGQRYFSYPRPTVQMMMRDNMIMSNPDPLYATTASLDSREATLQRLHRIQMMRQMNIPRPCDAVHSRYNPQYYRDPLQDSHFMHPMSSDRSKSQFHTNLHKSLQPGEHRVNPYDQNIALFHTRMTASASNQPIALPRFIETTNTNITSSASPKASVATSPADTEVERDTPSRFNIYCQLERQYILQRELDAPPSVTSLGESEEKFDPANEGFGGAVKLPRRYRGLLIPSNFYLKCPNNKLEEMMHIRFEMPSGIKCEYDISECIGRRWRSDVDQETRVFCDAIHRHLISKSSSSSTTAKGASTAVGGEGKLSKRAVSDERHDEPRQNNNKKVRHNDASEGHQEALPLLLLRHGHRGTSVLNNGGDQRIEEGMWGERNDEGNGDSRSFVYPQYGHKTESNFNETRGMEAKSVVVQPVISTQK